MALFGFFGRKSTGYSSPWLHLTVVYATSPEGLAAEHAFVLRGKVIVSHPIDFEFIKSGAFLAFFPGTAEGLRAGTQLAEALRAVARDRAIPSFGVSVLQGECLAQMHGTARFVAKPVGKVITQTRDLAVLEANAAAR